jgi:hypothetical protein
MYTLKYDFMQGLNSHSADSAAKAASMVSTLEKAGVAFVEVRDPLGVVVSRDALLLLAQQEQATEVQVLPQA